MSDYEPSRHREPLQQGSADVDGHKGGFEDVNRKVTAWLRKRGLIADPADAHGQMNVPGARYGRRGGPRGKKP